MRQASFSVGVSIVTGGSPNGNGCFISWNIRKWIADDSWKYPHDLGKKSMFTYVFLKKNDIWEEEGTDISRWLRMLIWCWFVQRIQTFPDLIQYIPCDMCESKSKRRAGTNMFMKNNRNSTQLHHSHRSFPSMACKPQVILLVSSKNSAAQRLYERMGYQLVLKASRWDRVVEPAGFIITTTIITSELLFPNIFPSMFPKVFPNLSPLVLYIYIHIYIYIYISSGYLT